VTDARREGASDEELAAIRQWLAPASAPFEVWPENAPAVAAFLSACSQWRVATLSNMERARIVYLGLDYAGARIAIEAAGIAITPQLWADLCVMEAAACAALNGDAR
jgi:Phage related hypothetical protein (DUF1799)